ncbi:hypothetical protein ID866_8649 [Astraeus odoratus]|nr:hypothetical protein ID866_8649 [Astraeus odoratus]
MPQCTVLFMQARIEEMGIAVRLVAVPSSADDKRDLRSSPPHWYWTRQQAVSMRVC